MCIVSGCRDQAVDVAVLQGLQANVLALQGNVVSRHRFHYAMGVCSIATTARFFVVDGPGEDRRLGSVVVSGIPTGPGSVASRYLPPVNWRAMVSGPSGTVRNQETSNFLITVALL